MKHALLFLVLACGFAGTAAAESLELSQAVQAHVREIHARNPELRDDAF